MEEKNYILFRQVWLNEGLAESHLNSKKMPYNNVDNFTLTALSFLESELLNRMSLRTIKLIFGFGQVDKPDTALLIFLTSMFRTLSKSDVKIESKGLLVSKEFNETLLWVKTICNDFEENLYTVKLRSHMAWLLEHSQEFVASFSQNLENGAYKNIINCGKSDSPIVFENSAFYFRKYYNSVKEAEKCLNYIFNSETGFNLKHVEEAYNTVFNKNLDEKLKFNFKQKIAAVLPFLRRFSIILGGPGTGKTSIIFQMIRVYCEIIKKDCTHGVLSEDSIKLCAPTARAALRMKESLNNYLKNSETEEKLSFFNKIEALTIHRLLQVNSRKMKKNSSIDADLIIVDEASMLDVELFSNFINRVGKNSSVVLIGDKNQLPSVEAGAVLGDLTSFVDYFSHANNFAFSTEFAETVSRIVGEKDFLNTAKSSEEKGGFSDNVVVLTESYRSSKEIIAAADCINSSDYESFIKIISSREALDVTSGSFNWSEVVGVMSVKNSYNGDISKSLNEVLNSFANFIKIGYMERVSAVERLINSRANQHLNSNEFPPEIVEKINCLFKEIDSFKILTLLRETSLGCSGINSVISSYINPLTASNQYYSGLPVIVEKNDYSRQLFNSDVGICLFVKGRLCVTFLKDSKIKMFNIHNMPLHSQAWAITVHKSQGSEYERVLLVMPEHDNRLLSKEIVYTAITRAKKAAIIFSKDAVLQKAISRKIERNSTFFS